MSSVDIVKVCNESDDWSALYVNNVLEVEGHEISGEDFIDLIRKYKTFNSIICFVISDEHMELFGGNLPKHLNDVNFNVDDID